MQDCLTATATELGHAIGIGDIDARDLTEAYLAQIDTHPERDTVFSCVTAERARSEADAAASRARAGQRRGALDGVPISWKDLFDTAGTNTEAGSALLAGRVPGRDAEVLIRASRAGLVCLGKTHMSELAFSGLGLNPVAATPPNTFDPARVPGGSSSGAAVSVGLNLSVAGIGSDTGGSVRIPSAWNDLVGLKTTHGLLSLTGVVPLCRDFDTVGPLCRSVADANVLLSIMAGTSAPDLGNPSLQGRRLLVLENVALDDIEPEPLQAFEHAVKMLSKAGAQIESGRIAAIDAAIPLAADLFTAEAYAEWGTVIEASPEKMFPRILERFRAGRDVLAPDYISAVRQMHTARSDWAADTAAYDAIILPTAPILPPDRARLLSDAEYYNTCNLQALRNTRVGNLMGLCGLTLPTGVRHCGVMALAPAFGEAALLRLGQAMEQALAE